ncbi:MAG: histidine--tRNA ligase [Candidatus Binatia bacterium]|nr:histidine--tRNA ligase [Candidatus Binatia bacterium]MDG2009457.1 histidine--tRNA ligase [Candidatus Binatia bacterium]
MAKNSIQAPRGTRDFYPEEMRQRTWLFENFRRVAGKFGFEEVDAPILEHAELFTRKAGEEIVDQLYHFELHDRHLALRPEMTPSVARMVMARAGGLKLPLRWFTVTQNWRYERMTRGRLREHYQWNMDIWGEAGVTAEAELIAALLTLVRELGLPAGTVKVRINSRALLEESLRQGVLAERPEAFAPLCVIIDKLDKIGEEAVRDMLCAAEGSIGLQPAEAESVLQMLRARNLDEAAEAGGEGSAALRDLKRLFELLEAYGVADDVIFDASVVRGLAYYTGIVFEAFDAQGELRAICGGGRYDRLLETLGGKSIPAVGFGFGDVVITELLKDQNLLPEPTQELDDIVFAFSEAEQIAAAQLATQLRAEGRQVELILGKMKPKRVFADAAAKGASRVFLIGPDDLAAGKAAVKELSTGEQTDWPLYPK